MRCPVCGSGASIREYFVLRGARYQKAHCNKPYCQFVGFLRQEEIPMIEFQQAQADVRRGQTLFDLMETRRPWMPGYRGMFLLFLRSIVFRLEKRWLKSLVLDAAQRESAF
jgi:hypothetical protein